MTLVILILLTWVLVATVAVVAGQTLVRRQQAQLIVDAAALTGAQKQAKGLNIIARLNEKTFNMIKGITVAQYIPWVDDDDRTWERLGTIGLADQDWGHDTAVEYQKVFDNFNEAIGFLNLVYASYPGAVYSIPRSAAARIVETNFGGADTMFPNEEPLAHDVLQIDTQLVKLTDPEEYDVPSFRLYLPYPGNKVVNTSICPTVPIVQQICQGIMVAWTTLTYVITNVNMNLGLYANRRVRYTTGFFYDQKLGDDVRFSYGLVIKGAPTIFGQDFFHDVPPIIVGAAAKPYGGHLGDYFETNCYALGDAGADSILADNGVDSGQLESDGGSFDTSGTDSWEDEEGEEHEESYNLGESGVKPSQSSAAPDTTGGWSASVCAFPEQRDNRTIRYTYRAKLVEMTWSEKLGMAILSAFGDLELSEDDFANSARVLGTLH